MSAGQKPFRFQLSTLFRITAIVAFLCGILRAVGADLLILLMVVSLIFLPILLVQFIGLKVANDLVGSSDRETVPEIDSEG